MSTSVQASLMRHEYTVPEPAVESVEFQRTLHQSRLQLAESSALPDQRSALGTVLRRLDGDLRSVLTDAKRAPQLTAQMSIEQLHLWGMQAMIRHTHARVQFDTLAASVSGVKSGLQQLMKGS